MIDAANTKIEAVLKAVNEQITVAYPGYALIKKS
jgi:hypothetical protein